MSPRPAILLLSGLTLSAAPAAQVSYRALALSGTPAPAVEEGVVFEDFGAIPGLLDDFPPVIDERGRVAFHAVLAGPGIHIAGNGLALYRFDGATLVLVARQGAQAPGTPDGTTFTGFSSTLTTASPSIAEGGVAFLGGIESDDSSEAFLPGIWQERAGVLALVARNGDPSPSGPSGLTLSSFSQPFPSVLGSLAFNAFLSDGSEGVFSTRTGALASVARQGDPAAGLPPGVFIGTHTFLQSGGAIPAWASDQSGRIALLANLAGSGVELRNDEAIFVERPQVGLTLLVREGDPAPGLPGAALANQVGLNSFQELQAIQRNSRGAVVFGTEVTGGGLSYHQALWTDRNGALEQVCRTGAPAPGLPGLLLGVPTAASLSDTDRLACTTDAGPSERPPYTVHGILTDRSGKSQFVVRDGDPLPDEPGLTLADVGFGAGSFVTLTRHGHVVFIARVEGADDGDFGLFAVLPSGQLVTIARTGRPFDVAGDGSDLRVPIGILASRVTGANSEISFELDFADGSSGIFIAQLEHVITDLGSGLAGTLAPPLLSAFGTLEPRSRVAMRLSGAPASARAVLVAGFDREDRPLLGGNLVPEPAIVQTRLLTSASGRIDIPFRWPVQPSGSRVFVQFAVEDPGAPQGFVFSNALELRTP